MSEFANIKFTFTCKKEPISGQPFELEFTRNDFKEVFDDDAESLFQYAALSLINSTEDKEQKVKQSLKYQVLCDHTAMVGVIKQKQSYAEVQEVSANMNQSKYAQELLDAGLALKQAYYVHNEDEDDN